MNIFVLDKDPVKAAHFACDKHVIKMLLETAQILSTVTGGPYRPTHVNHPCVLWAAEKPENLAWLIAYGIALSHEYTARYGKIHKSGVVLAEIAEKCPTTLDDSNKLTYIQCMPEQYKQDDVVAAYRAYYRGEKVKFATWNHCETPTWWKGK